jgi:hypothetical protein
VVDSYPTLEETCAAFAAAGFRREALERVRETYRGGLDGLLGQLDTLRAADTTMRQLTDDEFAKGRERLRCAAADGDEERANVLDLLVLR